MISAVHTQANVNYGDHGQDVSVAVEVGADETVEHLVGRLLTKEVHEYRAPGDDTPLEREGRYEDFIVLRLVKPVDA